MDRAGRWLALFAATRLATSAVGAGLLLVHLVPTHRIALAAVAVFYGGGTVLAAVRWPRLHRQPLAWSIDAAVVLGFALLAGQWRSPFYLLALTALIFPATELRLPRAMLFALGFTAAYFGVAIATDVDLPALRETARLESFATHLMVPALTVAALAYAADVLRRLQRERARSERLAVEAERRRIAWELHDSAKQRLHAAHLVLTQRQRRGGDDPDPMIEQALGELRAATADIETNLAELRTTLADGGLVEGLRRRAAELERAGDVEIRVEGSTPPVPETVAAHAFRVVAEAMTNAVRHAGADRILVRLGGDGRLTAQVSDDGRGLPMSVRPGSNGLRSMHDRAGMLGGRLTITSPRDESPDPAGTPAEDGPAARRNGSGDRQGAGRSGRPGTTVTLEVPLEP